MTDVISADVPVRSPNFEEALDDLPKYFAADGDLVLSHLIAVLSSVFPAGEDYFVDSVQRVAHRIDDPNLQTRVEGFIGQESMHGREHHRLNQRLAEFGYPTEMIERYVAAASQASERYLSKYANLAATAGLEHHTAIIAEVLLGDPEARASIGHAGVCSMFLWHALEESEHKAVAFDVYRHVGGSEATRHLSMLMINIGFVMELAAWTAISLALDPEARRQPGAVMRSAWKLRRSPFLGRRFFSRLWDYHRRGFHPDDVDTTGLIARWRARLLDDDGRVAVTTPDAT